MECRLFRNQIKIDECDNSIQIVKDNVKINKLVDNCFTYNFKKKESNICFHEALIHNQVIHNAYFCNKNISFFCMKKSLDQMLCVDKKIEISVINLNNLNYSIEKKKSYNNLELKTKGLHFFLFFFCLFLSFDFYRHNEDKEKKNCYNKIGILVNYDILIIIESSADLNKIYKNFKVCDSENHTKQRISNGFMEIKKNLEIVFFNKKSSTDVEKTHNFISNVDNLKINNPISSSNKRKNLDPNRDITFQETDHNPQIMSFKKTIIDQFCTKKLKHPRISFQNKKVHHLNCSSQHKKLSDLCFKTNQSKIFRKVGLSKKQKVQPLHFYLYTK